MQIANSPQKWTIPFANGDSGRVEVPATSADATKASLLLGFPPLTRTPPENGGVPPSGEDFNGAMNQVARIAWWQMGGGRFNYDATFATDTNVNGYPQGGTLASSDQTGTWLSLIDNNTNNPDTNGTGWAPLSTYGVTALTGQTGGTTTLTPVQAMKRTITIAGTLTSNLIVVLPAWTYNWQISNLTTGAFTVTVKTAAGSGTIIPQTGTPTPVVGDGTNIGSADYLRNDLGSTAAGKGSTLAAYIQRATGAYGTTVENKLHWLLELTDFIDPSNWSAALSGTFDVSPALGAAIDEALLRGAAGVRLPAGTLRLNATVTKTVSGINGFNIEGAGMGATKLVCYDASGSGLNLSVAASGNWWIDVSPSNTFRFAHFSICSTVLNLGAGILVSGGNSSGRPPAPLVFDHVEVRQYSGINTQAFTYGIRLVDAGGATFTTCRIFAGGTTNSAGIGVKIEATSVSVSPTDYHFVNCKFIYGAAAVQAGDYVEGLWFSNCLALGVNNAVKWNTTTGESGLGWTGGHVNANAVAFDLANLFDIQITGALIYAKSAIVINVGSNFTITGNTFYGLDGSGTGINLTGITGSSRGAFIGNNQFSTYTNGILIDSTSTGVTVGLNGYANISGARHNNASSTCYVAPRVYQTTVVPTLVGGAAFEAFNVAIPTGVFSAVPSVVNITPTGSSADYVCSYNYSASSATSVQVRIVRRDGGTISAGAARFHLSAFT